MLYIWLLGANRSFHPPGGSNCRLEPQTMTLSEAKEVFKIYSKVFLLPKDVPFDAHAKELWLKALATYTMGEAMDALDSLYKENNYWPTIRQFQERCQPTTPSYNLPCLPQDETSCGSEIFKFAAWAMGMKKEDISRRVIDERFYDKLAEKHPKFKKAIMDCKQVWVRKYNLHDKPKNWIQEFEDRQDEGVPF